jgi:hypothetical protein
MLFGEIEVENWRKILNIIHKDCDRTLAQDKSLPINSYLVTYLLKDKEKYDIVQAGSKVEVFDTYYDEYGKGTIKEIKWTDGKVSPKVYGYVPKETKKRK